MQIYACETYIIINNAISECVFLKAYGVKISFKL